MCRLSWNLGASTSWNPQGLSRPVMGLLYLFTRWRWVVNATPRPLYPRQRDSLPIIQETVWAPGSEWTGTENLSRTEIRSLDRPARSESLFGLRSPGSYLIQGLIKLAVVSTRKFKFPVERTFLEMRRGQLFRPHMLSSTTAMFICCCGTHGNVSLKTDTRTSHRIGLWQLINIMTDCQ
jgi:hypothetical protein